MENKQIILIGAIILIAISIICATVVFLNVNQSNKTINNETNNVSKNITVDHVNTEEVQQPQQQPQKEVYAYTSDGSPLYSYEEARDYIANKYGPDMIWHVQNNKYISLDTPGFTSDGKRLY